MDLIEAAAATPAHRHPWEIARLWVLRRLIRGRVQIGGGDAIVDIGCGDAFVVSALAREFPAARFFGIDSALTDQAIARMRESLPVNVQLFRSLDDLPALDRPACLILLMDVIEHIEDDHHFLVGLRSRPMVGASTNILVTVPAFQSLFSSHDVWLRHFRRYSNRQLRDRLEGAGLRVLDIGYFFGVLLPLRAVQLIKEKLIGAPRADAGAGIGLSAYTGGAIATSLMSTLLITDACGGLALRKIGIRVPGLSNFALCRTSA